MNAKLAENRRLGDVNKIYLIKMIREAQHQFTIDIAAGKTQAGQGCMGLCESRDFVEKYLEQHLTK